ncbi:Ciliogenesis-associated TTC17-interacting protein, partial [Eschrichtius robustus]|nr:Ciliogenesis-associated TTC17-interacting protein [Eschrichtius robustus]
MEALKAGYLSWKLEVVEQHNQEFIKFHVLPMERKMSLLKQDDQLAVTRIIKEGEEVKTEVTFFPWHSIAGFVSQAANLVLLRVMAWRQTVPSNARFLALDTEGKLCYSTYHPEAQALISDFLLFLLLRQPADVVTFAAEYFGPFAMRRPPTPALRSSNRPCPFHELEPEGLEGEEG